MAKGCCNKVSVTKAQSCCGLTFEEALNELDCSIEISYGDCVTSDQRKKNDIALKQLLDAVCNLKGVKIPKETTYASVNVNKPSSTPYQTPYGAPSDPQDGDIHIVKFKNGYTIFVYSKVAEKWLDITGTLICLDSDIQIQTKRQRFFVDNLVNSQYVNTGLTFTDLSYTDLDVFVNGKKIYCKDETLNGDLVYGFDNTFSVITFHYGAQGAGTAGDQTGIGTADVPAYVEVNAPNFKTAKDILQCDNS